MKASDKAKYERILEIQAEAEEMGTRLDRMIREADEMRREILLAFRRMPINMIDYIPGQLRVYIGTNLPYGYHVITVDRKP